mgnify:CR=1 FL=1
MKYIIYIPTLLFLFLANSLKGQTNGKVLTQEKLIWFLDNYHPISSQATLLLKKGESNLRKARGGFDPYLSANLDQKQFEDKKYYSLLNGGLRVPTWYGIELKAGFDQNTGVLLNPENQVPQNGLWYTGVSISLGKGLVIDKRRAALKQAQIFVESSVAERNVLMNNLYFDAIKQYWKWVEAWNQYQVFEESVNLAFIRFNGVKRSYLLGDKPAIDTLEAYIQVQNRQMNRNQSFLVYQNTTLDLSNYLWFEKNTPLVITDSLRPPSFENISLDYGNLIDSNFENMLLQLNEKHPEMQLYKYKLTTLELDRRLKADKLKPKLNINYNALNEPINNNVITNYSIENYKFGVEVGIPIFLREQRGDLQLAKLKIQETELGQRQKLLQLQNTVKSYYYEQLNLQNQVALFNTALSNYGKLLNGEKRKYNSGESSLFLINSRETKYIEAKLKLIALKSKYNIAQSGLSWSMGKLY